MFHKFHSNSKKLSKTMISEPLLNSNNSITPPSSNCSSTHSSPKNMSISSQLSSSSSSLLLRSEMQDTTYEVGNFEKLNSFSIEKSISKLVLDNYNDDTTNQSVVSVAQTLNQERNKMECRFYVYDRSAFEKSIILQKKFNIFGKKENGIGFVSCKHVLHELVTRLMNKLKEVDSSKNTLNNVNIIFSPNLNQIEVKKLHKTKEFIQSLFPHDGCSLKGKKLQKLINFVDIDYIIISIRVLIGLLPNGGLINNDFYQKFSEYEFKNNFNENSFYKVTPLISENDCQAILLQEFLELVILLCWRKLEKTEKENIEKRKDSVMDLLNTAAGISLPLNENNKVSNLVDYKKICISRNFKFQRIFFSYLRNLKYLQSLNKTSKKTKSHHYYQNVHESILLVMKDDIMNYPPIEYQTNFIEYGLVISIDERQMFDPNNNTKNIYRRRKRCDQDINVNDNKNFFKFLEHVESSQKIWYSNQDFFYFDEQVFLKKFLNDTCDLLSQQASDLSLEYLAKFDFDNQLYNELNTRKELRKHNYKLNSNSYPRQNGYGNFESKDESVFNVVKVSKMIMTNWFYNNWKLDTSMGNLKSTFIFELKQKIGQIQWLILAVEEFDSLNSKNCVDPELLIVDDLFSNKGALEPKYYQEDKLELSSQLSILFLDSKNFAKTNTEKNFTLVDNTPDLMFTISEAEEHRDGYMTDCKRLPLLEEEDNTIISRNENFDVLSFSSGDDTNSFQSGINNKNQKFLNKNKRKLSQRESYQSAIWDGTTTVIGKHEFIDAEGGNSSFATMEEKKDEESTEFADEFCESFNYSDSTIACKDEDHRRLCGSEREDVFKHSECEQPWRMEDWDNKDNYGAVVEQKDHKTVKQFRKESMMKISPGYASLKDYFHVEA